MLTEQNRQACAPIDASSCHVREEHGAQENTLSMLPECGYQRVVKALEDTAMKGHESLMKQDEE
eukprot:11958039-Prorocentrum_lima.AAC.1